jgi:hypothetical protein
VRRKFYELEQAHASPIAAEAIQRIGQLYVVPFRSGPLSPIEQGQDVVDTAAELCAFAAGGQA